MGATLQVTSEGTIVGLYSDQRRVTVRVLPLSEAKAKLSEIVDRVDRRNESVTITRNGKAVAMIVSKDEYDGLKETIEILQDPALMKEIRDGVRDLKRTGKRYTVDELFAE
jgi:prevent-host-death family protein